MCGTSSTGSTTCGRSFACEPDRRNTCSWPQREIVDSHGYKVEHGCRDSWDHFLMRCLDVQRGGRDSAEGVAHSARFRFAEAPAR